MAASAVREGVAAAVVGVRTGVAAGSSGVGSLTMTGGGLTALAVGSGTAVVTEALEGGGMAGQATASWKAATARRRYDFILDRVKVWRRLLAIQ